MKHPQNIRNAAFLFGTVSFVAAICLYAYMYKASKSLVNSVVNAREIVDTDQTLRTQGKEIVKLHESTTAKRDRLSSFFVPAENAVTVIQAIESIGNSSGATVSISSIKSSQPADPKEKIGQVTASVVIGGPWKNVMQALELFETLQYQNDIRNVNVNYVGQTEGKDTTRRWQASFDISVATIAARQKI